MQSHSTKVQRLLYLINISILTAIFVLLAFIFEWTPFGKNTLFTIDLGQQYVDFFSLYREALLNDKNLIIYSFQKSIGGEMMGLWAYYLMSPYNLILLLFKEEHIALAITLITYLKFISMGITFHYFAKNKYNPHSITTLIFSTSYAMMSYFFTYMLNIMWMDGLILLPLIALYLDKLINNKNGIPYVLVLSLCILTNYYIAFMICLFLGIYALFVITESNHLHTFKTKIKAYSRFIFHSIISVMISAVILYPAIMALLTSKASDAHFELSLANQYTLSDIFSKLFNGSFIYEDIKASPPNLYAGVGVLILSLMYFLSKKIILKEKMMALLIGFIFTGSFYFDSINQFWQGGQTPIWYYFRYSFTASFFMIILALKGFLSLPINITFRQLFIPIVSVTLFVIYYLIHLNEHLHLSQMKLFLTLALGFLVIFILSFSTITPNLKNITLLLVVLFDLFINSTQIISAFSYVQTSKFNDYITQLKYTIDTIQQMDDSFYRIHKNYARTKNEAFFAHYNGLDNFSSTIEAALPELFGYLGLPDNSGTVTYANGTIFTDAFFEVKYLLEANTAINATLPESNYKISKRTTDLDMVYYQPIVQTDRIITYRNPKSFGIGIEVSGEILSSEFKKHQPIHNQELLLQLIDFNGNGQPYYSQRPIQQSDLIDVTITDYGDGNYFTYRSLIDDVLTINKGTLRHTFDINSNNPYYFTLPSQLDNNNVQLTLDGMEYLFTSPFRSRQVITAGFKAQQHEHIFDIHLQKEEVKANEVKLYEFDLPRFETLVNVRQQNKFNVLEYTQRSIDGTINAIQDNGYLLFTIPYDKQWVATLNGKIIQTESVLNDTLLAIPITKGNHHIALKYVPKNLYIGGTITILGFIFLIVYYLFYWRFYSKRRRTL